MQPDFRVIDQVLRQRGEPERVPFYEHFLDAEVIEAVMGFRLSGEGDRLAYWRKLIQFYSEMGYDYLPVEFRPHFPQPQRITTGDTAIYSRGQRGWQDEQSGPIKSLADLRSPQWPDLEHCFDFAGFAEVGGLLPDGMKIIGGASGGPFEHASFLMGLESLALALYTDRELVDELFERIGEVLVAVAKRLAPLDCVGAYRFGDDLGHKTATILSPEVLRTYVFPWYAKVVEAVHATGKCFVLHSCGNLTEVMEDIIATGVDAKHSFEDVIMPVAEVKARWGDRLAILGGVDVDFLCRSTPTQVRDYTLRLLEACAPGGGYAFGSGNTITNYVPVDNYLAMMDAAREFNG